MCTLAVGKIRRGIADGWLSLRETREIVCAGELAPPELVKMTVASSANRVVGSFGGIGISDGIACRGRSLCKRCKVVAAYRARCPPELEDVTVCRPVNDMLRAVGGRISRGIPGRVRRTCVTGKVVPANGSGCPPHLINVAVARAVNCVLVAVRGIEIGSGIACSSRRLRA